MLSELCHELKNWFEQNKIIATIEVKDGFVYVQNDDTPITPKVGQYFRIVGSVLNDGIYQYNGEPLNKDLNDEVFDGAVWLLAIPKEVVSLSTDIDAWKTKYLNADSPAMSPFTSESFGGYSYSKASGANGSAGTSWQDVFKSQLNKWRKI